VVCFDECPIQLIGEVRQPILAKPRQIERYDCEYRRNGTANLFVVLDVNRPWRKLKVTEWRAAKDCAAMHTRTHRRALSVEVSFNLTEWFGPVGMELRGERERSPEIARPRCPAGCCTVRELPKRLSVCPKSS
jgi:hypothetical protein